MQRRYLDPVNGQAAYFGTVQEGEVPAIVTVRVRVENHRITEAEWYIVRKGNPGLHGPQGPGQPAGNFFDPDNLSANPPPERVIPKETRSRRDDSFDGITSHDGSIILAHPECSRTENGALVTGRGGRGGMTDCTSNLTNINVQMVAARRYPVVDEEAGVVLALAVFMRRPGTATRRNVFSEWFIIENSKIRSIYSAMFYPPTETPAPNWPPYDGNWPLPGAAWAAPARPASNP